MPVNSVTYFFAIFPNAPERDQTHATAALLKDGLGLRGSLSPASKLHLTCHFVTRAAAIDPDLERALIDVGDAVRADPFDLVLTTAITFEGEGRVPSVLIPDAEPGALTDLVTALAAGTAVHVAAEKRDYRAHVTFLRGKDRIFTSMPITPVVWQARAFVLAAGVPGERDYRIVREWALARLN